MDLLAPLGLAATAWVAAVVARRALGIPVGWPRTIVAGLLVTSAIGSAVTSFSQFTGIVADGRVYQGGAKLARSLRAALNEGGVTFVKLGQMLSTRRDLIPGPFADQLATLQTRAEPEPWPAIEAAIRAALGRPPAEVFAGIDHEPMAAASVAQVHAARLLDGREVVLKVQRPRARAEVAADMEIILRLSRRLERSTPWGRSRGLAERDLERQIGQLMVRYRTGYGRGGSAGMFGMPAQGGARQRLRRTSADRRRVPRAGLARREPRADQPRRRHGRRRPRAGPALAERAAAGRRR
ncbi:AarF/UbiB family protein [Nonomuraea sp. NPDC050790]|uniref:AarF/UbiB family protein n=1 Tax=Nonomuraea sp. NPDC050790 TaxID=3364371 RepID=UPI0037AC1528